MSVEKMAAVLHHAPVKGTAKLLLVGIANHEGDGGAWPAIATLARYANVTERNAKKMVRVLRDAGLVEIDERPGRTNIFRTKIECPNDCDGTTNHRQITHVAIITRVGSDTPTHVASDTPPMSVATPEPLINHQDNHTIDLQVKFDEFWEIYPKKTGRLQAFEEFELRGLKWDAIINGAKRYAESEIVDGEERWIKSPANFIRDETWRQKFKPGAKARRAAAEQKRAEQQQHAENETRELPPKCQHDPTISVLKCVECRTAWLAQPNE